LAMLDRKKLGQWQANNAKKAGAMIKTGSKVTSIGKDYVVVSNKEIYFKTLVGADGVGSIVRNHLGLKNNKIHLTMQYIIQGNFKELEIHFDSKICKEGYKWVFPHKGWASIGIGFDPKRNDIKKVRENFNIWLENKGIDTKKAKFESMPILYDYQGFRFGNIFLAGEAAGLTYGLTGEGIYPALASGEEVAKIIIDKNFNPILIPKILRKKKIQEILITIITRCSFLGVLLHTLGFWLMKRKKWQSKAIRLTLS
ncbi:MAG: NAD(P)/FAD-dependent oxidoreductase, partial [Nanoarchaeota archaeon]|nr:NAD(P)/FAD-dependent oxidoreductase [Nanoarchaeota archaeon]